MKKSTGQKRAVPHIFENGTAIIQIWKPFRKSYNEAWRVQCAGKITQP